MVRSTPSKRHAALADTLAGAEASPTTAFKYGTCAGVGPPPPPGRVRTAGAGARASRTQPLSGSQDALTNALASEWKSRKADTDVFKQPRALAPNRAYSLTVKLRSSIAPFT